MRREEDKGRTSLRISGVLIDVFLKCLILLFYFFNFWIVLLRIEIPMIRERVNLSLGVLQYFVYVIKNWHDDFVGRFSKLGARFCKNREVISESVCDK